jgi:threonyl-tRNA synthetase
MQDTVTDSKQIEISVPHHGKQWFDAGITPQEVFQQVSPKLLKKALAARIGDTVVDLQRPLTNGGNLASIDFKSDQGKEVFWHSSAHLMAQAVKNLYPEVKLAIGPAIEKGFYYDIDLENSLQPEDLPKIEAEIARLVESDLTIQRIDMTAEEAKAKFTSLGEDYKVELLEEITDDVSAYEQGNFIDMCRGPHVPSTGFLKNFKLLSLAGAYWRGDEKRPMLQRIYGISFPNQKLLDEHLRLLEEAKKRDHRKLGKAMTLFSFHQEAPGLPFWHHNGLVIVNEISEYMRGLLTREGYQEVKTPILLKQELWKRSGHWRNYKDNMYFCKIDADKHAVKPMNCPGGLLMFGERIRSYRELPVRIAELGLVHRHEKAGVLHGLFRVREFTQDDAHVYCLPTQIQSEVTKIIDLVREVYATFGFEDYHVELSTRPEKSIGSNRDWTNAENCLKGALDDLHIKYQLNPGDGAFYGPKIDFHIRDCLGRSWQCGTIQVDFSMPKRLGAEYVDKNGKKKRPVMIHRAIFGSLERFIGIVLEHFGGDLPLWIAPVQTIVLPIAERHQEYAATVAEQLRKQGLRVEPDLRNEKVGLKIREAELRKIPYMVIIGDEEVEQQTLSVRQRKTRDQQQLSVDAYIEKLITEREGRNPVHRDAVQ